MSLFSTEKTLYGHFGSVECPSEYRTKDGDGLAKLERWTGLEAMHRTMLQVPGLNMAYSAFMDGVERFKQQCSAHPTMPREQRVPMSSFTFALHTVIQNAYAVSQKMKPSSIKITEFQRQLAKQLLKAELACETTVVRAAPSVSAESDHIILEALAMCTVQCALCKLLFKDRKEGKSIYTCAACKLWYHVNCFAVWHNLSRTKHDKPDLNQAIKKARTNASGRGTSRQKTSMPSSFLDADTRFETELLSLDECETKGEPAI